MNLFEELDHEIDRLLSKEIDKEFMTLEEHNVHNVKISPTPTTKEHVVAVIEEAKISPNPTIIEEAKS